MRRLRSAGRWLILVGSLAASFTAAIEGRVGRASLGGLVIVATGILLAGLGPGLFASRRSGALIVPHGLRVAVPLIVSVTGGVTMTYVVEGHAGPVTRIGAAVLAVVGLFAIVAALLSRRDDGVPQFSLARRVGIPVVAVVVIAVAATVGLEDGLGTWTWMGLALLVFVAGIRMGMQSVYGRSDHGRWRFPAEVRLTAPLVVTGIVVLEITMALESRAGAVLFFAAMTFLLAVACRIGLPPLYATDGRGIRRLPRAVRLRVLSWAGVVVAISAVAALEGRIGTATVLAAGVFALVPVVRGILPVLVGVDRGGMVRFSRELRVGVTITMVFIVTLGALAGSLHRAPQEMDGASSPSGEAVVEVEVPANGTMPDAGAVVVDATESTVTSLAQSEGACARWSPLGPLTAVAASRAEAATPDRPPLCAPAR